jgi:hypothetical protein
MIQTFPEEESMIPGHFDSLRSRVAAGALALTISLVGAGAVAAQDATPAGDANCALPEAAAASPAASPAAEGLTAGPVVDDPAIIEAATQAATACAPEGATNIVVDAVYGFADGRYAVDYQFVTGKQLMRLVDSFNAQTGTWTLENRDASKSPKSELDSITASVKIGGEAGIELSPAQFAIQPAVNFHVNNQGDEALTFALYSGPADFDPASVAGVDSASLPDTLAPLGSGEAPAGTEIDVVFEGLEEGSYVIVIFDGSDTATNAALVTVDPPLDLGVPDVVGGGDATATPAS